MRIVVLAVPECQGALLLDERLAQVVAGRPDITVSRLVISDPEQAVRRGMNGSPTVLIDGIDPYAQAGQHASMSCRLYRHGGGRVEGAPSVRRLRYAIAHPVSAVPDAGSSGWLDELGRSGRGRVAPAERGLKSVHQAVLRSFAATGHAPDQDRMDQAARPFNAAEILAELAEGDFLYLDQAGRITAAYPFSATPTPHRVQITGGASAYAMCAIDALGMARMLGTSVLITSADPSTGEPISVAVSDSASAAWDPATTVVFAGRTVSECAAPSAEVCCGYMNFFSSHSTAAAWASDHREIAGGILSQRRALEVGERIFGQLLR
jgi:hypothetical protein